MLERSRIVLALARAAIEEALDTGVSSSRAPAEWPNALWLRENGASFVTLHRDGDLRGCIGSLEAHRPLCEDIAGNAVAAALYDRRFLPVTHIELDSIDVEVSILTASEPLLCADEDDAMAKLRPGIDGVILEYGRQRATFLPQVWDSLPEAPFFLRELKRKAGLPADFWHPEVRVRRYGVEKHCEREAVV